MIREGEKHFLFFTAYGQSDNTQTTGGPRAKKVSIDGQADTPFLPTPPDSPVFAELTTAGQVDRNSFQDGARAVPNLEMNTSITDYYNMNTVYSPLQPLSPSFEGSICDDPLGGSNNVLVKQELPDTYPDVFSVAPSPLDMPICGGEQSNLLQHQQFFDWPSQTVSVFEAPAHPQIKDDPEYSTIPSPTPSFDSGIGSLSSYHHDTGLLPHFNTLSLGGREHLNSGGEEIDNDDSCSEASFDLSTTSNSGDDSLDAIIPFDPNNEYQARMFVAPRIHNYKRNTLNQSVAMLSRGQQNLPMSKCGIPKVSSSQNPIKKRGRPRKPLVPTGDGNELPTPGRRGRGRREAMKGNHLWEFIRDLLKDSNFCPKYIRWEEKDEGVFRFVNSEAVASMWGRKKNNPAMTYEKLSRAMRYYYKRDILERVDGRRLVYKFGKNAVGWKQAAGVPNQSVDK
ncbi:uncharacterized protein [Amphiura filiformis]|uniref:uncharacterized protein isoform X2 n=1 Tax=Amphiura filiformis TaxID=82378 RepID=UPI003B221DE5